MSCFGLEVSLKTMTYKEQPNSSHVLSPRQIPRILFAVTLDGDLKSVIRGTKHVVENVSTTLRCRTSQVHDG